MSHDSPEFDLAVMTTAHENAIASLVAACRSSAKYQQERDEALAFLADAGEAVDAAHVEEDRLTADLTEARATLASIRAIVADPHASLVVERVRAALEPTQGSKP